MTRISPKDAAQAAIDFAGQLSGTLRERVFQALALMYKNFAERYVPSREIVQRPEFIRLGLTDVSILLAARFALTVLTADAMLSDALRVQDINVININHLRFPTF